MKPFGYWTTAETVATLLFHTGSGAIPSKYGLISVEAAARAVMERLAAGVIKADFRPPELGLFGIDVGFWDLDCSVHVFDRGRLEDCDGTETCMAMPDGTIQPMPLPADLLLWGAGVLSAFEFVEVAEGQKAGPSAENIRPQVLRTGVAGRPTLLQIALTEMERRAASGQLKPTLAQEAADLVRYLEEIAQSEALPAQVPKVNSLKNSIRTAYNAAIKSDRI